MNGFAYYNEIDPFAAQWLRNLIKAGHIANGVVDERSISDVKPAEIKEFTQCHFFAGIGVWSYALRLAGWDDNRPVWTGSCPCQPFSSAGAGGSFSDERHLWPHWFHLIQTNRPLSVFGEQVASKDGLAWLDLVQSDLEGAYYSCNAVDLCAAGVGAPHIRQRSWFSAMRKPTHSTSNRWEWNRTSSETENGRKSRSNETGQLPSGFKGSPVFDIQQAAISRNVEELADTISIRSARERREGKGRASEYSEADPLANSNHNRQQPSTRRWRGEGFTEQRNNFRWGCEADAPSDSQREQLERGIHLPRQNPSEKRRWTSAEFAGYGAVNGFWRDADWLYCRDEKYRPVKPGLEPLVDGITARMVRESSDPSTIRNHPKIRKGALRGYGNAINAEVARVFIESVMQCQP